MPTSHGLKCISKLALLPVLGWKEGGGGEICGNLKTYRKNGGGGGCEGLIGTRAHLSAALLRFSCDQPVGF